MMKLAEQTAINAMIATALELALKGNVMTTNAALEVINGARNVLSNATFLDDAEKAIKDSELTEIYYKIKNTTKN